MSSPLRTLPSVRTQLALIFGSLTTALAITVSLVAGEVLKWRLELQAGAGLTSVAHNAAMLLNKELAQQSHRAQVLARSRELWEEGLDSRNVRELLGRVQHINPYNVWIGVTDEQGIVRSATHNMLQGEDVSARPWFQQGLHAPFISEVHPAKLLAGMLPSAQNGEPLRLVDFSAPIYRPDGSVAGVLGIHSNWDWAHDTIERLLSTPGRTQQQSLFIFDREGAMIYAPGGKMTPYLNLGQTLPLPEALHRGVHHIEAAPVVWKNHSEPYLTTAVRLPDSSTDLGWWIVARQPVDTAYADANRILQWSLASGLIIGLLAAWLARWLARRVSDDLKQLAHAASQIQAGNTRYEIPLTGNNREVQQLSLALSHMTQQLLRAHEDMLQQVRQRTQQLSDANRALDRLASTDPLTGLLNRRGFDTQATLVMALAQRSGRPLSLIAIDIDFFKRINDEHGHDAGDHVLQQLAFLLTQRTRQTDLVARFGGEEFIILLPDTDHAAAQQLAHELVQAVREQATPNVGRFTISAGVSSLRGYGHDNLQELLKRSDQALYDAKNGGRNQAASVG